MNPCGIPKTDHCDLLHWTKISKTTQKWVCIGIFKPAEPHRPWVACYVHGVYNDRKLLSQTDNVLRGRQNHQIWLQWFCATYLDRLAARQKRELICENFQAPIQYNTASTVHFITVCSTEKLWENNEKKHHKSKPLWPTLLKKIPKTTQKWVWIGIFKQAEPHGLLVMFKQHNNHSKHHFHVIVLYVLWYVCYQINQINQMFVY